MVKDLTPTAFSDARFLVDASVTHPAAPSYRKSSALSKLHAAKDREARKNTKYRQLAAEEDCKFVAFVLESYGGFGKQAKEFMGELVRQAKEHSPPSVTNFRDYAHRALSVCLLNGNCFVLHNGCLRLREWDGKYRRDRRRQKSRSRYPQIRSFPLYALSQEPRRSRLIMILRSTFKWKWTTPTLSSFKWNSLDLLLYLPSPYQRGMNCNYLCCLDPLLSLILYILMISDIIFGTMMGPCYFLISDLYLASLSLLELIPYVRV